MFLARKLLFMEGVSNCLNPKRKDVCAEKKISCIIRCICVVDPPEWVRIRTGQRANVVID